MLERCRMSKELGMPCCFNKIYKADHTNIDYHISHVRQEMPEARHSCQ